MDLICEALSASHDTSTFACGVRELDEWLRRAARDSDGKAVTRTYVFHRGDGVVVAYYTLMPYLIDRKALTLKQGRGLVDRVPGYLLARLAVDQAAQGSGLGADALASALARVKAAESVGGRVVVVDAIDENAAAFYRYHGFELIAASPDRMLLRVKDLR